MKAIVRNFVRFLTRFYLPILFLGLVLLYVSWPRVTYLFGHISTDPIDLLPRHYHSVQTLLQLQDKIDQKRRVDILFESKDPEITKKVLQDLKPYLEKLPEVGQVLIRKPGYDFLDKNKLLYLDEGDLVSIRDRIDRKIQREKLGKFYISFEDEQGEEELNFSDIEEKYRKKYGSTGETASSDYYQSPSGTIFSIFVESKESNLDIAQEKRLVDSLDKALSRFNFKSYDPDFKVTLSGSARVREYRLLLRDLKRAGIISGIIIFLPLLLRFRRPQYVFFIYVPLILGIPAGLALSSLWISHLNITTSFLFAILGGLGVETGIHLFSRYYEVRLSGLSIQEALEDVYLSLGAPILTAVASLASTFFLMMFSDFRGFSEFGLITGIGLWVVLAFYFVYFPALLIFGEKIRLFRFDKQTQEEKVFPLQLSASFIKSLLVIFSAFTLFSLIILPKVPFEYNTKKIRADVSDQAQFRAKQKATRGGRVNIPAAVIIHSKEEAQALEAAIEKIKGERPNSVIEYTSSFYTLVPEQQDAKMGIIHQIQDLLADDSIRLVPEDKRGDLDRFKLELHKPKSFGFEDIPEAITQQFVGKKEVAGTVFLIFPKLGLEMDDGRNALELLEEIGTVQTSVGTYHPSSSSMVFAEVLRTMFRDSRKILFFAVASVFFFVYLDFRDWKKSSLVMFSILSGVLWVMGVLYLLGIKLNLYNMVMIPAVMGMSVDNSIHVYHRYVELGRGSLAKVLGTTGLTAALASLTNAAGFVGLAFCSHGGLRSMGLVAVVGVVTCLITTLVYLPMILQFKEWWEDRKKQPSTLL